MRMVDIIAKKRNGGELTKEEINFFIEGYTKGEIPDYQASALAMAIYFQKMNMRETIDLTLAMRDSGDVLKLDKIEGIIGDKHSTGGVGDKTSLVLIPLMGACGIKMAKMSGRGLGHTGGTIDKLESFPGFSTHLSEEAFISQINDIGIAINGQTGNLTPADKKLYALRDVTATVENMSLIAASIMCKKLAAGADIIVLDVKCGSGAFMKTKKDAVALAKTMVEIGKGAGKRVRAVVSDMDQPLGYAVGNILEVMEAVDTLKGEGPADLKRLVMVLGAQILLESGYVEDVKEAERMLKYNLESGQALKKFHELIASQGGDDSFCDDPSALLKNTESYEVKADSDGYVTGIVSDKIGLASMILGGGRATKESQINLSVGLVLKVKVADQVKKGDCIGVIYSCDHAKTLEAEKMIKEAIHIGQDSVRKRKLILDIID